MRRHQSSVALPWLWNCGGDTVGNSHALRARGLRAHQHAGLDALQGLSWRQRQWQRGNSRIVVLVPAHNEAAGIARTIQSLRMQSRAPDEITVVCDNCTDGTEAVARAEGA